MPRKLLLGSLTVVVLAAWAVPGRACCIKLPVIIIKLGKPAPVLLAPAPPPPPLAPTLTPPVRVQVPVPVELPPGLIPVPAAPAPAAPQRALTLQEFAAIFQPAPGKYAVLLIHPGTNCAVPVCFTLPPGCPKVRVFKREIEFDYGKHQVEIRARIGGKITVQYD